MNTVVDQSRANIERASSSFVNRQGNDLLIIDVRTPAEFESAHLENSIPYPLINFDPKLVMNFPGFNKGCLLVCQSGNRARQAAEKLYEAGAKTPLYVLEGGIQGWDSAGLPLIRGKKSISLERQVRITAGALVLMGVILSALHNPLWIVLSGFVGAGLVFAGITDTCGMVMLLSRMPWNQTRSSSCSSC
jgi:rhodanese-related sulfurtransferase